ncbi:AAA family ATPase [Variovorax paradoxus]|nr:ATP-binding protein [Variovorax paradoxus]MBT2299993.1 AAA family ATPase [Variovorax paradoxus]
MEHFPIVLGLCRASVQSGNDAVRSYVERLSRALEADGAEEQVAQLKKVLRPQAKTGDLTPNRVILSRLAVVGETLTPNVRPPVDKETGAALAEIVEPTEGTPRPIFNPQLSASIGSLLEEWRNADTLRAAGLRPALSTMIFGPPGTGKTMLAHFIGAEIGLPVVVAKLDGLISSFLGTTARNIANLFTFADRYRCVLLLDEFDAIAKLRDDPHELGEIKRVVNTLLQCVDARSSVGFTIAITNHEALLDPAVWRRFDIRIEVPQPVIEVRQEILRQRLATVIDQPERLRFLAWLMEGASGSDLEKLTDFLRRQCAIRKDAFDFLQSLRAYVQLSAQQADGERRRLVAGSQEDLARALSEDKATTFNQEQLAALFGKTQPTISRWVKRGR